MSIPLAAMPGTTMFTSLPLGFTRQPTSLKPRRALLVLDCQEGFLRSSGPMPGTNEATALIARNIKKLLPSFRRSGGDVLWIKTEFKEPRDSRTAEKSKINSDRQEKLGLLSADMYSDDGGSDTGIKTPISPGEPALNSATGAISSSQDADDDTAKDDPDAFLGPRFTKENKGFLKPGSDSAAIIPELTKFIEQKDKLITKTCYSAFEEGNLVLALRSRMVTELYIAGANTNSSMFATVSDASRYGFNMWILSDCVSFTDADRHENALNMMKNNFGVEMLRTVELLIKVVEGKGEHAKEGAEKVVGEEMVKNPTMDEDILEKLVESLRISENPPPTAEEEKRRSRPLSSYESLSAKLKALELDVDSEEDEDSSDDATEASDMLSLTESVEQIRAKILKKSSSLSQLGKQPAKNAVEQALEPRTLRRLSSKSSRDALKEAAAKLSEAREAARERNRPDPAADIGVLKGDVPKEPDKKIRSRINRTAPPPKAASPTNDLPEMPSSSRPAPGPRMERKNIVIRRRTSVKKGESKQSSSTTEAKKPSKTPTPPPASDEASAKRIRPSEKESSTKVRPQTKDNTPAAKQEENKKEAPVKKEEVIKDVKKDIPIVTVVSEKDDVKKVKSSEKVDLKKVEKSQSTVPSKSDTSNDKISGEQKQTPVNGVKDGTDVAKSNKESNKDSKDASATTKNPGAAKAEPKVDSPGNAKPLDQAQNPATTTTTTTSTTSKQDIKEDKQPQSSQSQTQPPSQLKSTTQSVSQEPIATKIKMSEVLSSEKTLSNDQPAETPPAKDNGKTTPPVRKRKKNDIPGTFVGPGDTIGEPGDGSSIVVDLLPPELAADAFERLKEEVRWRVMYHRGGEVPRLVAVEGQIGDDGSFPIYRHPADESPPLLPFSNTVQKIREHVEKQLGHPVNHVLIQYYRGGMDYISEHSDKTLDIVQGSYICNVSLGAQRVMTLRTKKAYMPHDDKHGSSSAGEKPATAAVKEETEPEERNIQRVKLVHNSLFVLGLETNKRWTHAIKQDRRPNSIKSEEELAYNGERISLTFRQIGTFLSKDETKIWGQGAKNKSKDKAGETICGNEEKAQEMIYAFAAENGNPDFIWEEKYGAGFDVLHFTPQMPKIYTLAAAVDGDTRLHPSSLSLKIALAELGLQYREQALKMTDLSDKHFAEVSPRQRTPVFVDVDPGRTVVIGEQGILTYLASTTRPGNAQQSSSPERYVDLLPDPKKDQCEFGRILSGFAELPGLLELTQKVNAFPLNVAEDVKKGESSIDAKVWEEVKAELKVWDKYFWKKVSATGEERRFTIFDCALVPLLADLLDGVKSMVDVEEYKTLKGYLEDARERESVRKVLGEGVFDFSKKDEEKKVDVSQDVTAKEGKKDKADSAVTPTSEKKKKQLPETTTSTKEGDKTIAVKTVASVPDQKQEQKPPQEDKAIEVKTVASSSPEKNNNNKNEQTHEGDASIVTDDSTTDGEGGGVKLVI